MAARAVHARRPEWLFGLAVLLLAAFLATAAFAQTFPKLTGRVVDDAHLLRPEQVMDLDSKLAALEAQSGGRQLVVATIPDLQGFPIEDYGYRLGRAWGIGQKGKDNGAILLVAPKERKVRIESGYGSGAYLTDAMSGEIIRDDILPRFKAGDMGGGVVAGTDAIIKVMSLPPAEAQQQAAQAEQRQAARNHDGGDFIPVVVWGFIIAFILLSMLRRRLGGRTYGRGGGIAPVMLWGPGWGGGGSSGWGGGGFGGGGFGGGGGFSGGGGSFGGGGASGSW